LRRRRRGSRLHLGGSRGARQRVDKMSFTQCPLRTWGDLGPCLAGGGIWGAFGRQEGHRAWPAAGRFRDCCRVGPGRLAAAMMAAEESKGSDSQLRALGSSRWIAFDGGSFARQPLLRPAFCVRSGGRPSAGQVLSRWLPRGAGRLPDVQLRPAILRRRMPRVVAQSVPTPLSHQQTGADYDGGQSRPLA
jgi:hypothetical protein